MSAQEIIAQLPKLDADQMRMVKAKLDELLHSSAVDLKDENTPPPQESLTAFLLRVAGSADDLPPDLAENHDHYLYGTPKRVRQ